VRNDHQGQGPSQPTKPEFSQAIMRGRSLADAQLVEELFQGACGYWSARSSSTASKLYRQDE
jgi:hypothetical protein